MWKPNREKLMRSLTLLVVPLILVICVPAPSTPVSQAQSPLGRIKDGVGVVEILIGVSSAADVEVRYGMKYKLINKNDYSYRMEYADLGLAFYYCYKDETKRIFLIELHHGVSSKGIIVGQSTLRDVLRLYGDEEKSSGDQPDVHEYQGIQFYIEHDPTPAAKDSAAKLDKLDKKVVEIDIVPYDKSSNFCD